MIKIFEGEDVLTIGNITLFILVFLTIFIIPVFPVKLHSVLFSSLFSAIFFTAVFIVKNNRKKIFIAALAIFVLEWISEWFDLKYISAISKSLNLLFFIMIVLLLILQVARTKQVTLRVIIEAVNIYLLMGLTFSILIALIMIFEPGAFKFPINQMFIGQDVFHFSDYLYFGFVTFTTLGYGDVIPVLPYAKSLTILAAVTGQIYIAVVIAMLVGKFSGSQL